MAATTALELDVTLSPRWTAQQARAIYVQGEEAVVFALLELAKHGAQVEGRIASVSSPATPSGMKPVHQKLAVKKRAKKPGSKAGHPGSRRPPPTPIDRHEKHRAKRCPDCCGRLCECAETRIRLGCAARRRDGLRVNGRGHWLWCFTAPKLTYWRLDELIAAPWKDRQARRLIKRLRRHGDHLLTFLDQADVPECADSKILIPSYGGAAH